MNCLRRSNIATVGELVAKGTKELLKLRNFGQKSYQEIEDRLSAIGLSLNPRDESDIDDEGEDNFSSELRFTDSEEDESDETE